ncbi:PREDICTED: mediator of RNA polymerase II transcription subunit 8 isoform X5 [Populus euphratica]|uniref:Mediator of RNA polymerase II transcription subunit 8 isoform X5 n=1 Tax=Populus euphratica TaxID=75702 RepID=A0AAJ6VE48_POPEU|nr:PREDICTED: mediator of RNA polymerase II transcription subunit 8 isoform X5 [Populus euphratica]
MAAMEGVMQDQSQLQNQQQQQMVVPERLNHAVQQQLNLESVKTRAISLFKALTRILEDFDAYARTNTTPKWQDILGQYSMVNLELFSIVDEIKKVSKAFVVHPKNVNAENAIILPVMLSSKLLPEMEMDDNSKREHLLQGMQSLPISSQIEKLKARIDMIAAACEGAEKVLADTRKAYQFGTRQGPTTLPTLDKAQAAKILEQENLLRAAVNGGEGLRVTGDQRQMTSALPVHLVDVLAVSDGMHSFSDSSGMYMKNTPPISNSINNQGSLLQQPTGTPVHGRSAASPSAATSATSFDHTTPSPLPYANSPRSGTNMMNTPSPQQQVQHQQQQQQRQKMMQLPQHQHQILAQQQLRQSSLQALGQMQYSQPMGHQQFQSRQLSSGHVQHGMGQSQLNQGNQLNRHLSQFSSAANTSLFNTGQGAPNTQMIPNMSSTMSSQPRMQFGLAGNNPQRSLASTVLNDQMYNMGVSNPGGMMPIQQQQQLGSQGAFGNMQPNVQNLQSSMAALQNASQNHPNFAQQRQQNQQ